MIRALIHTAVWRLLFGRPAKAIRPPLHVPLHARRLAIAGMDAPAPLPRRGRR
jgi:hypothetical protein